LVGVLVSLTSAAWAQGFNAGSDGALGEVVISTNTTITLPPDGKLQYRKLTVEAGATLNFTRNGRNTPVFILSQGDVVINGTISIRGARALPNNGGVGGPGGFDGGKPGFGRQVAGGGGYGPGGGLVGNGACNDDTISGAGAYGGRRNGRNHGQGYGNPLLISLTGGSGGGGGDEFDEGGGGGGGAILVASNTRIAISGTIDARGGRGSAGCEINNGSGGAVRLVAVRVEGGGNINVNDGNDWNVGFGRIRIDTIDLTGLSLVFTPIAARTVGSNLISFPPVVPRLDTIQVAGNNVPVGSTNLTFFLPFNSDTNRTVRVQARDFGRAVPIEVTLTPNSGPVRRFLATNDNTTVNPSVIEIPVTVPVNTLVTVHAWTK